MLAWVGCNGRGVALATCAGAHFARACLGTPLVRLPLPFSALTPVLGHAIGKRGASFDFWRSERALDSLNARAKELIDAVGLSEFEATAAVELPYGRKRALEIATTLALEPEMMLLDEPTAGMAHQDVDRIAALIKKAALNRTVLMVEHNLSVVEHLSDRITVLQRGEILAEGDYQAVSANPEVIQAYLGAGHG